MVDMFDEEPEKNSRTVVEPHGGLMGRKDNSASDFVSLRQVQIRGAPESKGNCGRILTGDTQKHLPRAQRAPFKPAKTLFSFFRSYSSY